MPREPDKSQRPALESHRRGAQNRRAVPAQAIRNAARAIIVHEGRLLTVKMRDREGPFFILPGGGQCAGETLHQTLKRECMEELGIEVDVGELLFVREYVGKNHAFRHRHANFHQVESVFRCTVLDLGALCVGEGCDMRQIGYSWLELEHLGHSRFFPQAIVPYFKDGELRPPHLYLGDVN